LPSGQSIDSDLVVGFAVATSGKSGGSSDGRGDGRDDDIRGSGDGLVKSDADGAGGDFGCGGELGKVELLRSGRGSYHASGGSDENGGGEHGEKRKRGLRFERLNEGGCKARP